MLVQEGESSCGAGMSLPAGGPRGSRDVGCAATQPLLVLLVQEGIGLDAINDAFLLESSVYRMLKKYCGERPYYLHLLELFLQVRMPPTSPSMDPSRD